MFEALGPGVSKRRLGKNLNRHARARRWAAGVVQ
jgi:hypothetical protein